MAADKSQAGDSIEFGIEALRHPGAFPHPVTAIALRETSISRIILTGPFAYKIKKAVHLDFIDCSTLERRRELCDEELRLNRRLAPDLYCDVVPVTRDASGQLRFGGVGPAIEYAVRMRQFDSTQELHALLERNEVDATELRALANHLADFHARAAVAGADSGYGSADQLRAMVLGTLATLLEHVPADEALPELDRLRSETRDQLRRLEGAFEARKEGGAVRECHGDLHARNIVRWQGELTPFDCLEFDPKLRWIDVMNDVAFLVMDLTSQRRGDLAFAFLSEYLERTGDYDGVRLLGFYAVYRASVRAMVDALGAAAQDEFRARLRVRIRTAVDWLDRPPPVLILMHGPSGSGKSWLSERLVPLLSAVRIRSDLERKRLADLEPQDSGAAAYQQGVYDPQFTHRTYARLLDCAESCLQGGVSAIVDAAFLDAADRRLFHDLAMYRGVRYLILSCSAAQNVLEHRIAARRRAGVDPSDAGLEILTQQLRTMQPFEPYERPHLIEVKTAAAEALAFALAAVERQLAHSDAVPHSIGGA